LHGGLSSGAKTEEGRKKSLAALKEGQQAWVQWMKDHNQRLPFGRKPKGYKPPPVNKKFDDVEREASKIKNARYRADMLAEKAQIAREAREAREAEERHAQMSRMTAPQRQRVAEAEMWKTNPALMRRREIERAANEKLIRSGWFEPSTNGPGSHVRANALPVRIRPRHYDYESDF
jgi:hypothetical protein